MKKLLFFLFLLPLITTAQEETQIPNYFSNSKAVYDPIYGETTSKTKHFSYDKIFMNAPVIDNEIEMQFIRYCHFKYYKQRSKAYLLSGAGLILSSSALILNDVNPDLLKPVSLAGAALNLAALVIFIDADKWLKYSTIKPSKNGIGINITF